MSSKIGVSNYKNFIAIGTAAILLAAIFVPFQKVDAFTLTTDLPNTSLSSVPTSAVGSTFRVTIAVAPGELVSINQVEVIVDNGKETVKQAFFNAHGNFVGGEQTLIRGKLQITIPTPTYYGYAYGYGPVSAGSTYAAQYTYAFPYTYTHISGNTVGYTNQVGNVVSSFIGNGQDVIIIEGKLNTARMSVGQHTLDVLIDTGSGVGPDVLVAPQISFTTIGNSSIQNTAFGPGNANVPTQATSSSGRIVTLTIPGIANAGNVVVEEITSANLNAFFNNNLFTSVVGGKGIFTFGGTNFNTIGPVLVIDVSALGATGPITVTAPFDIINFETGTTPTLYRVTETGALEQATGVTVDFINGTVTGTFANGLSPVFVAASTTTAAPAPAPAPAGGGGGGGGTGTDTGVTYPPSYFVNNPLAKVQVSESGVKSPQTGVNIASAMVGQQVQIHASFKNFQDVPQQYAIIMQVIDADGFTADFGYSAGVLDPGQSVPTLRSWIPDKPGQHTIKVMVWDAVSGSPTALSTVYDSPFSVN